MLSSITVNADDTIQQFIDAFEHLKQSFRDRQDTDRWKIAGATKEGIIQLVTMTERVKYIGELKLEVVGAVASLTL